MSEYKYVTYEELEGGEVVFFVGGVDAAYLLGPAALVRVVEEREPGHGAAGGAGV